MLDPAVNPSDARTQAAAGGLRRDAASAQAPSHHDRAAQMPAGFTLARRLPSHRIAHRWLARRPGDSRPLLVYGLQGAAAEQVNTLGTALSLQTPHALPVEALDAGPSRGLFVVSPFPGSYDGLLSLGALLSRKTAGQFGLWETRHAVDHLLSALEAAREHGAPHGELRPDEVLVDRRARLRVELCGVESALRRVCPPVRIELDSVSRIALELLTGVPGGPPSGAGLPSGKSWRAWRRWFEAVPGLPSCAAARETLPQ